MLMSLQVALYEYNQHVKNSKARASGDMPPKKVLKTRCFEIEFCSSFDHVNLF